MCVKLILPTFAVRSWEKLCCHFGGFGKVKVNILLVLVCFTSKQLPLCTKRWEAWERNDKKKKKNHRRRSYYGWLDTKKASIDDAILASFYLFRIKELKNTLCGLSTLCFHNNQAVVRVQWNTAAAQKHVADIYPMRRHTLCFQPFIPKQMLALQGQGLLKVSAHCWVSPGHSCFKLLWRNQLVCSSIVQSILKDPWLWFTDWLIDRLICWLNQLQQIL